MWQDVVNAALELMAITAMVSSIRRLRVHRKVRGVHPWHAFYSVLSASWFNYYYAHLEQWWSFACALGYCAATVTWVGMMLWYYWGRGVVLGQDPEL